MVTLTNIQRLVLLKAALRGDHILSLPTGMHRADYLGTLLVARNLAMEVESQADWPVWRQDLGNRPISLKVTPLGLRTLHSEETGLLEDCLHLSGFVQRNNIGQKSPTPKKRLSQKQALALRLMEGNGATLDDLTRATGWKAHSARARLSGLRKHGYDIKRFVSSRYRVDDGVP